MSDLAAKLPIYPLTVGKLEDLSKLITRVEGTELYHCFDPARLKDAKALFQWACGDGISKPSREDIHNRVLELTDPKKYAEKQQKAAEKPDGAQKSAEDEVPESPENLISTEVQTRPAPNWKGSRRHGSAVPGRMQTGAGSGMFGC